MTSYIFEAVEVRQFAQGPQPGLLKLVILSHKFGHSTLEMNCPSLR